MKILIFELQKRHDKYNGVIKFILKYQAIFFIIGQLLAYNILNLIFNTEVPADELGPLTSIDFKTNLTCFIVQLFI